MMNKFIGIGRLTRDPELRYTPEGTAVTSFTIAVDQPFTNQQGERKADFIDCIAWRKLGETVGNHLRKGRLVAVDGRLQIRSYEAQDGSRRRVAEIVANNVQFLDAPKGERAKEAVPVGAGDSELELPDDLPF